MIDLLFNFRTFCRVVERGSLSRAGIDLNLAQASVSRHIKELESRYGTVLIARSTRRLQVTQAGQQVYEYAKGVLRSESGLADRIATEHTGTSGVITIAAPTGFGHAILNPFITQFIGRHPDIRPRLLLSERSVNLIEDGIDVAIRIGEQTDSNLIIRSLGALKECLVVAPMLIPKKSTIKQPSDLIKLPRLAMTFQVSRQVSLHKDGQTLFDFNEPKYATDSSLALRDALIAGGGYGVIHEYLVLDAIHAGRLVRLLDRWTLPNWPVNALFSYRSRPRRVDNFIDALVAHLNEQKILVKSKQIQK
jgi:DNA-binding transcriptional LysR family regulator